MGLEAVAAVLVGGQSRRMGGRAKAALPLGAGTVLERVLDATRSLDLPIRLVGACAQRSLDPDLLGLLQRLALPVDGDRYAAAGPLAGLDAAFAATGADRVLLLACDLPFLTGPFLAWLLEQGCGWPAAVPADDREHCHPLCAVYGADCRPTLTAALETRRLRLHDFARDVGARWLLPQTWARFDPDGDLLANLNTPADYERARTRVATREAGA